MAKTSGRRQIGFGLSGYRNTSCAYSVGRGARRGATGRGTAKAAKQGVGKTPSRA